SFVATLNSDCSNVDPSLDCTFDITGSATVTIQSDATLTSGTSYDLTSSTIEATIHDPVTGACTLNLEGPRTFAHANGDHYKDSHKVGAYSFGSNCGPFAKAAVIAAIGTSPSSAMFDADFEIS